MAEEGLNSYSVWDDIPCAKAGAEKPAPINETAAIAAAPTMPRLRRMTVDANALRNDAVNMLAPKCLHSTSS